MARQLSQRSLFTLLVLCVLALLHTSQAATSTSGALLQKLKDGKVGDGKKNPECAAGGGPSECDVLCDDLEEFSDNFEDSDNGLDDCGKCSLTLIREYGHYISKQDGRTPAAATTALLVGGKPAHTLSNFEKRADCVKKIQSIQSCLSCSEKKNRRDRAAAIKAGEKVDI